MAEDAKEEKVAKSINPLGRGRGDVLEFCELL